MILTYLFVRFGIEIGNSIRGAKTPLFFDVF